MSDWPFVRSAVVVEETGSTSDLARDRLSEGRDPLPLLVLARRQIAGRGRGAHTWWSDEGSLTATVAFRPSELGIRPEQEGRVALATAVAIINALESLVPGAPFGIRWPNDIEIGRRKLGGLLPERVESEGGPYLLVGIGINVTTRLDSAPSAIRAMATSLAEVAGWAGESSSVDPTATVLRLILERLPVVLAGLAEDSAGLAGRWAALDTLAGEVVRVDLGSHVVSGTACGIDNRGGLRLRQGDETMTLFGGQVLRRPIA